MQLIVTLVICPVVVLAQSAEIPFAEAQQNAVSQPMPAYPALAKEAKVSGTVQFKLAIDAQGGVGNAELISGHPLLIPGAQHVVKNWRYRPFVLSDGTPRAIITRVGIKFDAANVAVALVEVPSSQQGDINGIQARTSGTAEPHGQQAGTLPDDKPCRVLRKGVTMSCPDGWIVLVENDYEAVVANFRVGPGVTKNTRSGQGKATIAVSTMPKLYQTLADWIYAAHKNAPDAVEKKVEINGGAGVRIPVVWFASPALSGPAYSSYFFQAGRTPVLIELMYRADDPKRDEYQSLAKGMIGAAVPTI
jgi:hypothetical protein